MPAMASLPRARRSSSRGARRTLEEELAEANRADAGEVAEVDGAGRVQLSEAGRKLQFDMNLQQKAMRRIKMDGSEADALLDELFAEID